MCIRRFVTILAGCCLLACLTTAGGCTEAMRKDLDGAARGAVAGGKATRDAMKSPAGELVPEPLRSSILLGATALEALALAYLKTRKAQTDKKLARAEGDVELTSKAVADHRSTLALLVKVIEALPANLQKPVKAAIAQSMAKDSDQNALIDDMKVTG